MKVLIGYEVDVATKKSKELETFGFVDENKIGSYPAIPKSYKWLSEHPDTKEKKYVCKWIKCKVTND